MFAQSRGVRVGGFVSIQAVFIVLVFAAVAVAHYWSATKGLQQSRNQSHIQSASLEAESGVEFLIHLLKQKTVPGDASGRDLLDAVYHNLAEQLDGTATLGGDRVKRTGWQIVIPPVYGNPAGGRFTTVIELDGDKSLIARVTGDYASVSRTIRLTFDAVRQSHPMFRYGIAAQGPVALEHNVAVRGANAPWEADLFSAWPDLAFRLEGSLSLDGDIYAGADGATVNVNGDGTIGETSMSDPAVMDHVHLGVGDTAFPEIDISPFTPYATNVVDSDTRTNQGGVFENIRIVSGANPSFEGGAELRGVIYVEPGNEVKFSDNVSITGIIVTEQGDPGHDEIKFEHAAKFAGLDELPDTEQWTELRDLAGAFLLAPGFRVHFEHDTGAIGGAIAADYFKFEHNFDGSIKGGIYSYGTVEMKAEHEASFTIDRSGIDGLAPIGFVVPKLLCPVASSYTEL